MKRIYHNLLILLPLLVAFLTAGCEKVDHDATDKVTIELSDAVAKVATMRVVYQLIDEDPVAEYASKTYSKTFTGSMREDASGDYLSLFVYLELKDNYREVIRKMSTSELYTFYNHCKFSSDLKVEIKDEPALNTTISGDSNEVPEDGIVTADRIIETLERHAEVGKATPLFMILIKKNGTQWKQSGWIDPWCEKITVTVK